MDWLNFRHLYAFWMVCKHGGFRHAAERMFIAQSAVSDHVAQLEAYLDVRLFDRSTRRVALTAAGKELEAYADVIFSQSRAINQVIREGAESGIPAHLNIGIEGSLSRNFLFSRFSDLLKRYPQLKIDVRIGAYEALLTLLRRHDIDLALATRYPDLRDSSHYAFSRIGSTPLCIAGQPALMNALGTSSSSVNLFVYHYPYEGNLVEDLLQKRLGLRVTPRLYTEDISLLRFFANSEEGLAVMPLAGIQNDMLNERVQVMPLREELLIHFYAIYLKDSFQKSLIDRLFPASKQDA